MAARAFITGISGLELTAEERAFVRETVPWGFILFKRNIDTPDQVRQLTAACREAAGRDVPILVDQEGGRVQRLGPPHWPAYPAGAAYGRIYQLHGRDAGSAAARLGARLIAADLRAVGIDVDCLPLADVPSPGSDFVIGDRAYGEKSVQVWEIARGAAEGLLAGGVLPVLKHIPGHGRATVDSHRDLPVVDTDLATLKSTDFDVFRGLSYLPLAMTAHVVFTSVDAVAPATTSATLVSQVIRDWIGFRGLLMSDDISMGALSGAVSERALAAFSAGCDLVLHCNGKLDEMHEVAEASPVMTTETAARSDNILSRRGRVEEGDLEPLREKFFELMAEVAKPGVAAS